MKKLRKSRNERGSALLVTLMVMVGLSLLGLGFVTISETESAISVNERNYTQTLQSAEAGAKTVAEWFNLPEWALENGLMPVNNSANEVAFKVKREVGAYDDYYRPFAEGEMLFDSPYTASPDDRLYGTDPDNADITIDRTTAEGRALLDQFNDRLFTDANQGGFITRIAIYAPPIVGGTSVVGSNGVEVWQDGTRYGIATIAVTAQKFSPAGDPDDADATIIAQRTVKLVLAEMPFPGADGPLQSNANITTNGSFEVHWGKVTSNANLHLKDGRFFTAIPWINAWDEAKYEIGYDPQYDEAGEPEYLFEMIGKRFQDPWFEARSRGALSWGGGGLPAQNGTFQPWTYTSNADEDNPGVSGYSSQFQQQNQDNYPSQREALFVRPVYQFWKQVALTGATQQGIHYLRYKDGEWYDVTGETRTFEEWTDTEQGADEGFFFFDTLTGASPQNPDNTTNTAILSPEIKLQGGGGNVLMRGFFYLNASNLDVAGISGPLAWHNLPSEPFRDVGFQEADTVTGGFFCKQAADPNVRVLCDATNTAPWKINITNYQWDYQDLNDNGKFDVYVAAGPAVDKTIVDGGTTTTMAADSKWFPVPYDPSCFTPGSPPNLTACSEPHEPYLNITGPWSGATLQDTALTGGGVPYPLQVGWEDPTNQTQVAKVTDDETAFGAKVSCPGNATVDTEECTSNSYDKLGGLIHLDNNKGPMLDGIIYNEGGYKATGNALYYGSVLIWGPVTGAGTPNVFYDSSLKTGDWFKRFENLPRTIITSIETDQ